MIGAIIGDIAGSRFEWSNIKTKDFELFDDRRCEPTDDSVMSLAIAKAIIKGLSQILCKHCRAVQNRAKIFQGGSGASCCRLVYKITAV